MLKGREYAEGEKKNMLLLFRSASTPFAPLNDSYNTNNLFLRAFFRIYSPGADPPKYLHVKSEDHVAISSRILTADLRFLQLNIRVPFGSFMHMQCPVHAFGGFPFLPSFASTRIVSFRPKTQYLQFQNHSQQKHSRTRHAAASADFIS